MSHYFKKQLKIGLGWIIIIAIIIVGIYFLFFGSSTPTCFDGVKNQNEESVDCGGVCRSCTPEQTLEILFQVIVPTLNNNYDLATKIKNPNSGVGAEMIDYQFNLYDDTNQIVSSKAGKTYILPQETKYVVEPKFYSEKPATKIEFKINNISWKKIGQISDLELQVKNTEYQILEDGSNVLVGAIENRSSYDLDTIEVAGVLFDENNKIIAVGKTSMNTVLRNESRGFEIFWPYPVTEEVKSFDVKVYTNVFLNDNFIKTHGNPERIE